ncbi:MAG TPA: D-glycero-beta-D-manno-heptose-7-phosphate kinase [Acidobacteriaceae bacterium]|nr:D-glycero-beta-D-manno-heptose-7-phosphate kinase [Acidobacteriaceae bacterium]
MNLYCDTASFIDRFPESRLLVIGDVMLDKYIWGDVQRISPEAPVPIVEEMRCSSVPGGMANVAVNAATLGARVAVGGAVGGDSDGSTLCEMLNNQGIDTSGLRTDPHRRTSSKTRVIAHNQQVVRIDREDRHPISPELEQELLQWWLLHLPDFDICVLSDYAKGVLTPRLISRIIATANQHQRPVVVDPKGWDYRRYHGASIITPNLQEARQALTDSLGVPADLLGIGAGLLRLLPGTAVLVTRGPEGVSLFREGTTPMHIPSVARQVYDVTGAGDTLVATLALAMAVGCPLELASRLANYAAGRAVGKVGTASVTANELRQAITSGCGAPDSTD